MSVSITGGEKLQAFLNQIKKQKADVKAGFFEDAKYPDGTQVARVAIFNEYGAELPVYTYSEKEQNLVNVKIPARPFMSDTVKLNKTKWYALFGEIIKSQTVNVDVNRAFNQIGLRMQGDIKKQIKNGDYTSNSPATLAHKKGSKPLVDTGQMLASVNYKVKS